MDDRVRDMEAYMSILTPVWLACTSRYPLTRPNNEHRVQMWSSVS